MKTKMLITFKDHKKIQDILQDSLKAITPKKTGVEIHNFYLLDIIIELLSDATKIKLKLDYDVKRFIIEQSLFRVCHYKIISPQYFRRAIKYIMDHQYFNQEVNRVNILFFAPRNIINYLDLKNKFTLYGKMLNISDWAKVRSEFDIGTFVKDYRVTNQFDTSKLNNFTPCVLEIDLHLSWVNINNDIKPFELFRGIVNYALDHSSYRILDPISLPMNKFPPSPVMPIFDSNGKFVNFYVSKPQYPAPTIFHSIKSQKNYTHQILDLLSKDTEMSIFISDLLVKYTVAFDNFTMDEAYLSLWIILERIAYPLSDSKTTDTLKRLSGFIPVPNQYKKDLADILRRRRNDLLHKGLFPHYYSGQLKLINEIVKLNIYKLLENPMDFNSLNELEIYNSAQHMDLKKIQARRQIYQKLESELNPENNSTSLNKK